MSHLLEYVQEHVDQAITPEDATIMRMYRTRTPKDVRRRSHFQRDKDAKKLQEITITETTRCTTSSEPTLHTRPRETARVTGEKDSAAELKQGAGLQ